MQPEENLQEGAPPAQAVAWLEEERRRDRAEVQRLQHSVEQLASRFREVIGRLEIGEVELRQMRGQVVRLGQLEGALRQARETLVAVQEWQEDHEKATAQAGQTQALEAERDRRAVGELQTQASELTREADALKQRLALLAEEVRRDRGSLPPLQQDLESLRQRLQVLLSRADLTEETLRHRDARLVELGQHLDRLSAEQSRFTDWQRLAEVRWSRRIADWQQQMEEWRRQAEDASREIAATLKQLPTIKDELNELRRALGEEREQGTARATAIAQLAAQREIDREALAQAERTAASLAGRVDDLTGHIHGLADRLERAADQQQALDGRLRAERERVERILLTLARLETHDEALERRDEETSLELAGLRREQTARAEEIARDLADLARRVELRLTDLERLEEEHKQREIAELEQQIREMQERARQAKG